MSVRKFTKLKIYLMERGITQRLIQEKTSLSSGAVNRLINNTEDKKPNKATIKLVCLTFGIPESEMESLLVEHKKDEAPATEALEVAPKSAKKKKSKRKSKKSKK